MVFTAYYVRRPVFQWVVPCGAPGADGAVIAGRATSMRRAILRE
jgi:hypothetical protein